jgi:hypothetical protein
MTGRRVEIGYPLSHDCDTVVRLYQKRLENLLRGWHIYEACGVFPLHGIMWFMVKVYLLWRSDFRYGQLGRSQDRRQGWQAEYHWETPFPKTTFE